MNNNIHDDTQVAFRRQGPIKILGLSSIGVWDMGEGKGHSSVYKILRGFVDRGHEVHFAWPRTHWLNPEFEFGPFEDRKCLYAFYEGLHLYRFRHDNCFLDLSKRIANHCSRLSIMWSYAHFLSVIIAATVFGLRVTRKVHPDVIYGHNVEGAYAGFLVSKLTGIPNVTRLYGSRLHPFLRRPKKLLKEIKRVIAYKLPCSFMIMTDDGTYGDIVMRHFGVPPERIRFWKNGVDDCYDPDADCRAVRRELELPEELPIIMMACRLVPWKRVDLLVRAAHDILVQHPDVMFVILGDGVERFRLERMAKEFGVECSFRFVGSVKQNYVGRYMNCADIFCSLAELSSAANPLLEAMMCARCVVASDTGNVRGLIEDGNTGWLFPAGDVNRLTQVVCHLLEHPQIRQQTGAAAREIAKQRFHSWKERVAFEIDLIESLVYRLPVQV